MGPKVHDSHNWWFGTRKRSVLTGISARLERMRKSLDSVRAQILRMWRHKGCFCNGQDWKAAKMGLLPKALKTLEILEKPEVIFKRRLKSNPFHPFNNIGGNSKWILEASDKKFHTCSLSLISYYHNRSKLALLKVHSLNSWLVSVTRNSGYHLCSDLSSWMVETSQFFSNSSNVDLIFLVRFGFQPFAPFGYLILRFRTASFVWKRLLRITEVIFTKDCHHCKVDIATN